MNDDDQRLLDAAEIWYKLGFNHIVNPGEYSDSMIKNLAEWLKDDRSHRTALIEASNIVMKARVGS